MFAYRLDVRTDFRFVRIRPQRMVRRFLPQRRSFTQSRSFRIVFIRNCSAGSCAVTPRSFQCSEMPCMAQKMQVNCYADGQARSAVAIYDTICGIWDVAATSGSAIPDVAAA